MKQYIQNLQAKTPHEQRMHAMRLSGMVTVAVFFVWLTATGVRLSFSATGPTRDASGAVQTTIAGGTDQNSQIANVVGAVPGSSDAPSGSGAMGTSNNTLVVATSTQ